MIDAFMANSVLVLGPYANAMTRERERKREREEVRPR
jgi:hypothetical protein